MAVSGGRLHIGGTFKTVNATARTALGAVAPVTGAASPACSTGTAASTTAGSPPERHPRRRHLRRQRHHRRPQLVTVNGMSMASGRLIYAATTTGTLSTVDFRPASPPAPPRW
jgi:hypothetical protein